MTQKKFTLIVARHNEDLNWIKKIKFKYIVYNKGKDDLPKWVKNVIKLPNIDRKAVTYLTQIIDRYSSLPGYSVFVQGNPFDHSKNLIEIIDSFDDRNSFFDLSDINCSSGRFGNKTHFETKVSESAQKIFADEITNFGFGKGAQFIVSKEVILYRPKKFYERIFELMLEGDLSDKVCERKNCLCAKPFSAWILERLWRTIFDRKYKTIYN